MKKKGKDISIRLIKKNDVKLFRKVRLNALRDSPASFGQKYDHEIRKPLHYWQDLVQKVTPPAQDRAFLLFKKEKAVGMIFGFIKEKQQGSVGGMWIHPNYRKQGFASKLVKKILKWARDKKLKTIKLWNVNGNQTAEKLYRKFGFQLTGKQKPLESNQKMIISEFKLKL